MPCKYNIVRDSSTTERDRQAIVFLIYLTVDDAVRAVIVTHDIHITRYYYNLGEILQLQFSRFFNLYIFLPCSSKFVENNSI